MDLNQTKHELLNNDGVRFGGEESDYVASAFGSSYVAPHHSRGPNEGRQVAESAIHFMMASPDQNAILLDREWHVPGVPFSFANMFLYLKIVEEAHCCIRTLYMPAAEGFDHMLFATRDPSVSDQECLATVGF